MKSTLSESSEVKGTYCHVKSCRCGCIYLTIGPMTLKLNRESFASVVETLNQVQMESEGYRSAVMAPRAEAIN